MKNLLFVVVCISILFGMNCYENNYTRENCVVVQTNDGWVSIEDRLGFTWKLKNENLKVGDTVNLKMHTNYTVSNVNDDTVKKVVLKN